MWIMTTEGMVSIVTDENNPGCLQIRARNKDTLKYVCPGCIILATPHADYEYRCVGIPYKVCTRLIDLCIHDITYPNFKGAVALMYNDKSYEEKLHKVWAIMREKKGKKKK